MAGSVMIAADWFTQVLFSCIIARVPINAQNGFSLLIFIA